VNRSNGANFPRFWLAAAIVVAALAVSPCARAHAFGVSVGDYTVGPDGRVHVALAMREADAALVVPGLDADGDRHVTTDEIVRARRAVDEGLFGALAITADGRPCRASPAETTTDPPDGVRFCATYECGGKAARLHVRLGFLDRLPPEHRHLATAHLPAGETDVLATSQRPDWDVSTSAGGTHSFASLARGGVDHIVAGPDHLAFLLAIVVGATMGGTARPGAPANREARRRRVGDILAVLTAFTVGHSASLAIATLGGVAPASAIVEPAVALSVAYVGAENLWARGLRRRWLLTLAFGFVHGFAFAGGLLPLGFPRAQLPAAVFAFNVGLEAGQLLVVGVLLAPLALLHSRAWYPRAARWVSAGIAVAGVAWFLRRIA
jgi:HupE/UreJ protein